MLAGWQQKSNCCGLSLLLGVQETKLNLSLQNFSNGAQLLLLLLLVLLLGFLQTCSAKLASFSLYF